ncbi:RNA polymerase sigma factor [Algoriphagus winogradskyi]|uniref:RNA polymerase sigma-70 factor, ECF subfamily n=1 Tax=Algoriphagus winogradskyi TaxID=237017 RepID=A0ABY1PHV6_9BACT|nr:sigma-70 family RNA polymerase sigma factor [Algoriphagus winogradskyi]SMP33209.1 RNA polymerase sigma-70 factor, ECF subfamily [Algoriphagus winogradskyi]
MKHRKDLEFENLYKTHKDKIFRLCLGFVKDRELAHDLFQEILIKIWRHLDSFRSESELSTWIYRIAYNTAITFSAKEKKKPEQAELPNGMDLAEPENNSLEQELQIKKLYEAISSLAETDRVIATLLLENTPYKTIAEITGITENYVAVKVNRIKASLTQLLNPYGK